MVMRLPTAAMAAPKSAACCSRYPVRVSRVAGQKGTMPAAQRQEASMAAAVRLGLYSSRTGSARPWYSNAKASPATEPRYSSGKLVLA